MHSNVKSVGNISRRDKNHKTCAKKALTVFWFLFGDFNILNIFYKIQNLNEWQLVSVITYWTYTFLNPWALEVFDRYSRTFLISFSYNFSKTFVCFIVSPYHTSQLKSILLTKQLFLNNVAILKFMYVLNNPYTFVFLSMMGFFLSIFVEIFLLVETFFVYGIYGSCT